MLLQPTVRGYGIAAALEKCRALAGVQDRRADTGGLQEAKAEKRKAFLAMKSEEPEKSTRTLEKLPGTYGEYLKAQGRRSHDDAQGFFRSTLGRHGLWGRTANKLRSYLRVVYQCALDVRTLVAVQIAFKAFGLVFNSAAQTR